ncbi:2,4-dienoyl-CoA reductase [Megasphaera cerevisiae DSM 20462]|uniref:2,4-dienoyl-CoA reductase n=1 Tax=Megasphaera cerevisiae DSM 20462 TaxID=1122219 RepID=A0A0J6WU74_9FIRM|nr:FAD-dependent oxidoreductase [Megasphaera cerevisiae]KMO85733.1 2,4-dienoyl-CoA reductase [Megasphaera cerevisiae DSM 20462]SJZ96170.1 2,4-dienoyl-CoA reductase [Megasphaera cerevisiae DSM 20462]
MSRNYPHIFEPLTVKRTTFKNRVIMPPMGSNLATFTGEVSEDMKKYYGLRARGGTALITVENACIDYPLATNGTKQLRIDKNQFIPGLYELTERIHAYGALASIQLNHAGASAYPERLQGLQSVSASSVPSKEGNPAPRPLTKQEILNIVTKYAEAAQRAVQAGFDMVEIHGGHSYLLDQFLSPLYNKRTDEFGGSYENRARFARLVIEAVRSAVGKWIPISFRISAAEFIDGGNTLDDTLKLLEYIQPEVDIINVSAAVNDSIQYQIDKCDLPDGWRAYLSQAVKDKFGKPVILSGNIRNPEIADQLLADGKTDFLAIGRGLIADPDWARKAQSGRANYIRKCISCNIGCADHRISKSQPLRCTVNPDLIYGEAYKKNNVTRDLHVVVIGGGTSGLETACTAAEAGCRVTLIERERELGGLARKIARFPEKSRIEDFPAYLEQRASHLPNLTIKCGTTATKKMLIELKPDILYAATGSKPMLPPIEGLRELTDAEGTQVKSIYGFMDNIPYFEQNAAGKNVAIIGCGAVGLDVMEFFTLRKAHVTMIEMMPSFGKDADVVSKSTFKELLATHPVDMHLGTALQKVCPNKFIASHDGHLAEYPFDYGFICMGLIPDIPAEDPFKTYAEEQGIPFCNLGNSRKTGQIIHGTEAGRNILHTIDMIGGFD